MYSHSRSSISVDDTRCIVIAVPDAGCFYSSIEKLRASSCWVDGAPCTTKHYIPMDIAWLRIRRETPTSDNPSWFRKGGYVNRLLVSGDSKEDVKPSAWKVVISHKKTKLSITSCPLTVLRVKQAPDDTLAPLPPDVFVTKDKVETLPANIDDARRQYQTELDKSPSSKGKCRHYVAGALHRNIPQGAYIVRPISDGAFDFIVSIQVPRLYSSENGPLPDGLPDDSKFDFVSTSTTDTASTRMATKKFTKWVTQRESVVKVRYLKGGSNTPSLFCL